MQIPCVERPPGTPPTIRHGQIGSQMHDSKSVPLTRNPGALTAIEADCTLVG